MTGWVGTGPQDDGVGGHRPAGRRRIVILRSRSEAQNLDQTIAFEVQRRPCARLFEPVRHAKIPRRGQL